MKNILEKPKVDQVLRSLASTQRRQLLQHLVEESRKDVDQQELAQVLADADSELHSADIQLKHQHLPLLQDSGLVEYDPRSEAVRLTEMIETVEPLLEACKELEQELGKD